MRVDWYPGHMIKTKKTIKESLVLVDLVYEVIDARIPYSSQNPDIDTILENKPRLIIMNKSDLASKNGNEIWQKYFNEKNNESPTVLVDSLKKKGLDQVINESYKITKKKRDSLLKRGVVNRPIRAMIVGIPNVGKSTLLNSLTNRKAAKVGNKPGITKVNQWVKVKGDLELLDTPGMLWPNVKDENVKLNLGFTGTIKDNILDTEVLAIKLVEKLISIEPKLLENRYKISIEDKSSVDIVKEIGKKRGCIIKGGEVDFNRASMIILDEFRKGILGRATLELP